MPVIHGVSPSPFVRKVRVFMIEKGLEYELEPVMPGNVPDSFRKISPLAKVPVYEDGEFSLPDSSAICAYLERAHPEPPLYPDAAGQLGRALWLEEYADTKLVEVLGPIFSQRFIQRVLFKQECDEALVEQQMTTLVPPVFDYLESEILESQMLEGQMLESQAATGGWVVGDVFGIADISLGSCFVQLRHGGEAVDADRWPRLSAYAQRVLARDSFATLIAEEEAAFPAG